MSQAVLAPRLAECKLVDSDQRVSCAPSLRGQRDAPGVGHLALLQVLHQLSQPALGGGVVLQHLGEGAVLQLVGQTLTQGFSGSEDTIAHVTNHTFVSHQP